MITTIPIKQPSRSLADAECKQAKSQSRRHRRLALAHQLLAEEESMDVQRRRKLLKKAGKLFQCALNMSIDEELDSSSFSFTLAAMNNMGVIYYQLDENEAATNCFERLMSIIVYLHGSSFDASHYVGNACAFISDNSGKKLQKNDRLAAAA